MGAGQPLVIIADDDDLLRQLVSHQLHQRGFATRCVSDGEELLTTLAEVRPDLIVLDAMMPGIDGYETLRRLRAGRTAPGVPVIMLTAKRREADIVRALELGASDYVSKPFLPDELALRVKQLILRPSAS
jgi:DNA-binding response OmpR family regulator